MRRRPARSACGDEGGQHRVEVGRREPGPVARRADRGAGAPGQEVAEPLGRRAEAAAARAKRRLLDRALQLDAASGPAAGRAEVVRADGDDQPGVRERRVAARQAHAVDDDAVGLGRRRDDPAARAHAEAVDAALGVARWSARRTRAAAWDGRRRRRTGSRRSAAAGARCARRPRSACARARCRPPPPTRRPARAECPTASTTTSAGSSSPPARRTARTRPPATRRPATVASKRYSTPSATRCVAQRRQHARQPVRADVRARLDRDLVGRAEAHQIGDHVGDALAILRARVELAVGVRPRAALAEAVVRARRRARRA